MKFVERVKGWILIGLLCGAVVSLITLIPAIEKNFSNTWIVIQILATAATFIGVSIVGPIIELKWKIKNVSKEKTEGGEKE